MALDFSDLIPKFLRKTQPRGAIREFKRPKGAIPPVSIRRFPRREDLPPPAKMPTLARPPLPSARELAPAPEPVTPDTPSSVIQPAPVSGGLDFTSLIPKAPARPKRDLTAGLTEIPKTEVGIGEESADLDLGPTFKEAQIFLKAEESIIGQGVENIVNQLRGERLTVDSAKQVLEEAIDNPLSFRQRIERFSPTKTTFAPEETIEPSKVFRQELAKGIIEEGVWFIKPTSIALLKVGELIIKGAGAGVGKLLQRFTPKAWRILNADIFARVKSSQFKKLVNVTAKKLRPRTDEALVREGVVRKLPVTEAMKQDFSVRMAQEYYLKQLSPEAIKRVPLRSISQTIKSVNLTGAPSPLTKGFLGQTGSADLVLTPTEIANAVEGIVSNQTVRAIGKAIGRTIGAKEAIDLIVKQATPAAEAPISPEAIPEPSAPAKVASVAEIAPVAPEVTPLAEPPAVITPKAVTEPVKAPEAQPLIKQGATEEQKLLTFRRLIKGEGFTIIPSTPELTKFIKGLPENITRQQAISRMKASEDLGLKLAKPLPPSKIAPTIKKVTGVKKVVTPLKTTEQRQLKFKLREQVKAARQATTSERKLQRQKKAIATLNKIEDTRAKIDAAIEVEELAPAPFKSQSSAFNQHVPYFQARQLPAGSQVRGILGRIRTVARLRRTNAITASQSNRETRKLRKQLFLRAREEGVAIRMTPGGKIVLAVRDSGVFVGEDFANYKKFKDLDAVFGGGTDATRMIQGIDGSLTKAQKLKEPGQAGPLEQNVLWPTRDMTIQKLTYIKEKVITTRRIVSGVRKNSKKDIAITRVLREISSDDIEKPVRELLKRPDIAKITKSPEVVARAIEFRKFYNDLIDEQNAMREIRNQDAIKFRRNYSPEILRDATIWERYGKHGSTAKETVQAPQLPDYIQPNKPFNPRELAREFGIPFEKTVKSSIELAENYIATAAKDIFNTSIIQNNKAYIQQLETMGFQKSANTIAQWTAEAYAGIPPQIDKAARLPKKWTKGLKFFNRARNLAVFPFNFSWNFFVQTSSFTVLTPTRFGTINTVKGLLNWARPSVRKRVSNDYYSFIVKSFDNGKLSRQEVKDLLGSEIKIYKSPGEILDSWNFLLTDQIERLLTGASIEAARFQGQRRGLEGEALRQFASDGGGKTQSMYNAEDKPGVLRNLTVRTAAPYQTFAFEISNTIREWAGKTGTPPDNQMERIWWLLRFMAGVIITASAAKKVGRSLWDWARPPLPFAEMWLNPITAEVTGEYANPRRTLIAPVQIADSLAEGVVDVLEKGSWRKLRSDLIKWGPGLFGIGGGIAASRVVDSLIAYSEGGVYSRSGNLLFKIEDKRDLLRGMFGGVWATKGGQEYLKKKNKEGIFKGVFTNGTASVEDILERIGGLSPKERRQEAKKERDKKKKPKSPFKKTKLGSSGKSEGKGDAPGSVDFTSLIP